MDNRGRVLPEQDILTEVQFKNLDTGKRVTVSVEKGPQVVPLPPGRYCANWFRTYKNVKLDYCRKGQAGVPTATVFPGLPTNAGRWILGIEYAGSDNRINYRVTHGVDREEVAAEALAKLGRPAVASPAQLQGTVWLGRDLYNVWTFIEFGNDGVLYEHGGWNGSSDALGPWRHDGDRITVTLANGHATYDLALKPQSIEGWSRDKQGNETLLLWSPELLAPVPFNTTGEARIVHVEQPKVPEGDWPGLVGGEVRVAYHVPEPVMSLRGLQLTVNPTRLRVLTSDLPEAFNEAAMVAVDRYRFAPGLRDEKPIESDGEVTVRFDLAQRVVSAPGEPASAASSKADVGPALDEIGSRTASLARRTFPKYPPAAVRRRLEGEVLLSVEVRADGTVGEVRVLKSSGHEELDAEAIKALLGSTYYPAFERNRAIDSIIEVPSTFSIR
jgi:TonB family protein